ncbi:hypothetical protein [Pseudooceanicola nanhaiensis]|uniref:hypothetical protein n=1 Tax=Pseudooceanicola nanhaiensis TaxID=375761 RepID=UPI001CD73446|nr:hypothetical protein [Pseudooceanicola nanhaiensis]MCA0921340.1 hypothetical protein [Pseudooceanicola nanhaiensis]
MRRGLWLGLALMLAGPAAAQLALPSPQDRLSPQQQVQRRLDGVKSGIDAQRRALETAPKTLGQQLQDDSRRQVEENQKDVEQREVILPDATPELQ